MKRIALYAILLLLVTAGPAWAQQEDIQAWEQLNLVIPIAPRIRLTLEQIARTGDRQGGVYTSEFGALIGGQIADGVELGLGYRKVSFYNRNRSADEDRLRQQLVFTRGRFVGRLRLDERFSAAGKQIGFRIRPLMRLNFPLNREKLTLFVSHESFILPNTTSWGQRAGYERMRNLAGFSFPLGKALTADIGYLNQFRLARHGAAAQMNHALNIQLTINLGTLGVIGLHG